MCEKLPEVIPTDYREIKCKVGTFSILKIIKSKQPNNKECSIKLIHKS